MTFRAQRGLIGGVLALLLLAGCATTAFNSQTYTVKSGDTLYFIAWKYKLDYKELAAWNQLSPPYELFPGDRILIHPVGAGAHRGAVAGDKVPQQYKVQRGDTVYGIGRKFNLQVEQIIAANKLRSPYTLYPGQMLQLDSGHSQVSTPVRAQTSPPSRQTTVSSAPPRVQQAAPAKWLWPVSGPIVKTFKGRKTTQQGIDIAGQEGQYVKATAGGEVVYSGNGLINYGQLIIVKHNDVYLSAYAYNKELLVKEGDRVKAGQPIAKIGQLGQSKPQLHFEIRKYGKPVNPLGYLQKRS